MQNLTKRDIATIATREIPVVRTSTPSPFNIPRQRTKRYCKHRHTVSIAMLQCLNAVVTIIVAGIAFHYLIAQTTFLVVSFAIIAIIYVNFLCAIARRKSIDMMETMEHPALKIWSQRQRKHQKALYTEDTNVFLKSIKASILEKSNEKR